MRLQWFFRLAIAVLAVWPLAAAAQQAGKVPLIGYLSPSLKDGMSGRDGDFLNGLRGLGYVEGKNIVIEYRFANGRFDKLGELAAELVRLDVDVIVAAVTQASLAAKAATKTIPVVMLGVSDPINSGLVRNIARPEANVTGTSSMTGDVAGKWLEILKEVVPNLVRVAVLWNPGNAMFQQQLLHSTERAAAALGLQLVKLEARGPADFERAFQSIAEARVGALQVLADPTLITHRARIIALAAQHRIPAIFGSQDHAEVGGLMSYAPDMAGQFHRGAFYVDRILKGAKPADLPVERPTKFELAINMKTAKALGLSIPLPLLGRADKLIE